MKSNILKKIAYSIIILVVMSSFSLTIFATSTSELKNKQADIEDKINETNSEIAGVKSKMTDALNEVSRLNSEISNCETKISELEFQIQSLTTQISDKQKNIEEQQAKYEEQQELLNKRLVAVYQSGNTTYLDVLLSSSSLTDFISKYYLIETLASSDTELLTRIQNLKVQIEQEKVDLENKKKEIENAKKSIEIQKISVENLLRDKKTAVANLNSEEKALQAQLDEFEQDRKEIQREIAAENKRLAEEAAKKAAEQKANNSSSNSSSNNLPITPSSSGFICPLAGRTKNDITTGFYGYKNHNGVDFARNSKGAVAGLPVLAAKSGTVIISKALKRADGSYKSYGEYIVINHGDCLTVYAHMQAGSRKVQKGDKVSQGQAIGNVGSTGNSTGPHLHFEIQSLSGSHLNPTNYLP